MGPWAREDIRAVLAQFGVSSARRAIPLDPTEEVILLSATDFARIDPREVAMAIMAALPHRKVLVAEEGPRWDTEAL
jgi:hypothetical protein